MIKNKVSSCIGDLQSNKINRTYDFNKNIKWRERTL